MGRNPIRRSILEIVVHYLLDANELLIMSSHGAIYLLERVDKCCAILVPLS